MIQIFSVIFKSQILFHYFKKRKVGLKMIRKLVQNYVAGMWHSRNLKTGSLKPGHSISHLHFIIVVQSLSRVQLFGTPWTAACQASLSFTVSGVCSNSPKAACCTNKKYPWKTHLKQRLSEPLFTKHAKPRWIHRISPCTDTCLLISLPSWLLVIFSMSMPAEAGATLLNLAERSWD